MNLGICKGKPISRFHQKQTEAESPNEKFAVSAFRFQVKVDLAQKTVCNCIDFVVDSTSICSKNEKNYEKINEFSLKFAKIPLKFL